MLDPDYPYPTGDLARTGYITASNTPRKTECDLPKRHIELMDYRGEKAEVLTVGDSFSLGGAGGKNPYYQDYIASVHGLSVLNITALSDKARNSTFEIVLALLNKGYLDKLKPRYIVIQTAERSAVSRLSGKKDFNNPQDGKYLGLIDEMIVLDNREYTKPAHKNLPVYPINNGNMKFLLYNFLYLFSDHAFTSKVCRLPLSRPLFSVNSHELLFYIDDVLNIREVSGDKVAELNDNLNALAEKLGKKNIKLYLLIAPDKYDVYSEYIIDNPYQENSFFDELRKLDKKYRFIDTKRILSEAVRKGEKDLYFPDDTHWSNKASKLLIEAARFD
jgi:hypothetical protein